MFHFVDRVGRATLRLAQRLWRACRGTGHVLGMCRFALATLVLVGFAMIAVPQGQDLLRFVDESLHGQGARWAPAAWFLFALWIWALSAWYFSRIILAVLLRPGLAADLWLVRWVPRLIGVACFAELAVGLLLVGAWGLAAIAVTGGAAFLGATSAGQAWLHRTGAVPVPERSGQGVRALPRTALWLTAGCAVLAFALFVAFWASPVRLPQRLGSAAIVMLAASTWIPFGTALVYLGHRGRLPLMSGLAVLVILFSFWNDNHALRLAAGAPLPQATASLREHLSGWLAARTAGLDPKAPIPIVLVVTEGGGSRAAYWTAHVLATLEERAPGFSRHVYAISAVSGGALGAAVFAALMSEPHSWPADLEPSACHDHAGPAKLDEVARCIAGRDFLSPALAGLLYPDLMARFAPWPIPLFDRSGAVEGGWEAAWKREVRPRGRNASDRFGAPFLTLWSGPQAAAVPNLVLNGTWVETGQRAITTNLRFMPSPFAGALDVLGELGSDVPLSTAVHSAARFPLVSPAGLVVRAGETRGHVVDGGFFENAGATAALELLDGITWLRDLRHLPLRLIVVAISNDPTAAPAPSAKCGDPVTELPAPLRGLELRAPLSAVFNARDARGQYALRALEATTRSDRDRDHDTWFFRFGLRQSGAEPLGWQLSGAAQHSIASQLDDDAAPFCNSQGVEDLAVLLR